MKNKKSETVLRGFKEIVKEFKRKLNKLWFDQGKEFHNSPMEKWLDDNDILMYSIHNEGTSVVAATFIETSKGKTYKKNDS